MGKKFDNLEHKIAREYEAKGVPEGTAEDIGRATAGKIARMKLHKG